MPPAMPPHAAGLPAAPAESAATDRPRPSPPKMQAGLRRISIEQIDSNPAQPRQEFDPTEMQSLAESIAPTGCCSRSCVRKVDDRYQLIAGERRLRAAMQAGWTDVPVNIIEADDRQTAELAIVENLQRKDLNPLEKAASFQRYLEQYGCTQEELAAPAEPRPLDDRQPDPAAGTARAGARRDPPRRRSRKATPGRCCRWATSASRSRSASGFSAKG